MFQPKTNHNKAITDILEQLEVIERNRGEPHKAKAYQKASSSLSRADKEIISVRLKYF
jgi:DNA polymerase/3'-5' exonuclease PolX